VYNNSPRPNTYVRVMVFNTIFNNILAILWGSVLLVEETEIPVEKHYSPFDFYKSSEKNS
jgi:hypothetical protein